MSMMAEDGNESSKPTAIVVAVMLALILYVLSPGPLVMLEKAGAIAPGGAAEKVAQVAMVPLRSAFFQWEPVAAFYEWWLGVWK